MGDQRVILMLASGFKLVPELADGLVLVLVAAFELVYLLLEGEQDASLRLDRLTVALHAHLLLLRRGLVVMVVVALALLLLTLALRTLVGALLVPANLINHIITNYQPQMNVPPLIPLKQLEGTPFSN